MGHATPIDLDERDGHGLVPGITRYIHAEEWQPSQIAEHSRRSGSSYPLTKST